MKIFSILFFSTIFYLMASFAEERTTPALIPLPEKLEWGAGTFRLSDRTFYIGPSRALMEYLHVGVQGLTGVSMEPDPNNGDGTRIVLSLYSNPSAEKKENYTLTVTPKNVQITAVNEEGLMRGMQTFFQLIPASAKKAKAGAAVQIPAVQITDSPKFSWRGLNLDCSRHFMEKNFIKRYIDILAYYKFNVFHWHLTDDQGWRIEIKKYPKLTSVGAWRKEGDGTTYGGFYTQDDIREIVAYARSRYITVVPEIEMPGHSTASLASYPGNSCTGGPFEVVNVWGVHKDVYCAGRESTFAFLQDVLDEVIALFPGKYIHIGGDEAPKDRWKKCPKCQARIRKEKLKDERELQSYFIKRISTYLQSKGKAMIGWDEILEGGLAPGAIVQSWQSFQGAVEAAKLGHQVICSPASHTYFNGDPDNLDLRTAYSFMPAPDELTPEQKKLIIGGEANLWTEQAPQETVDGKLFPRMLALSEVFWNDPQNKNYDEFHARVQQSYDDLTALGIQYGRESKVITPSTTYDAVKKQFTVLVTQGQKDVEIRYTVDGKQPDSASAVYASPITIDKTATVKIAAFRNGRFMGKQYSLAFDFHKALGSTIVMKYPYDERYRAGGKNGLIDGVRGTTNFRDGTWQGYEGVHVDATIDLGSVQEISTVTPRFLLDVNSFVFLPVNVEIALSADNKTFTNVKTIRNTVPLKNSEIMVKAFPADYGGAQARYIRVHAESIKKCPMWHPGAGAPSWLFIDEIVVQ